LYRELDSIEDETGILKFQNKLKDRFGKIPLQGQELIRIVRLKRLGKKLGIDKIILKMGKMNLYLVTYPDSPYYQSEAFDKLLKYVQMNYKRCQLKETNNRRSVLIQRVDNVESACQILEKINFL
jgi:transcription-repair coupling factor (superfamily II helicase)